MSTTLNGISCTHIDIATPFSIKELCTHHSGSQRDESKSMLSRGVRQYWTRSFHSVTRDVDGEGINKIMWKSISIVIINHLHIELYTLYNSVKHKSVESLVDNGAILPARGQRLSRVVDLAGQEQKIG